MQQIHAAGLQRPNVVGARSIGMGGAFVAVADDATAVWHNPAGTALYGDNSVYIGAEMVLLDRAYTPSAGSFLGMQGITKTIHENTGPVLTPILGVTTRFGIGKQKPSRFALSLGVYIPYGGSINFADADVAGKGILHTQLADIELSPTLAYQVSDVLLIGAALRIGVGIFSVTDVESAFKAKLSMNGVGAGATLGVLLRPHWRVQVGAVYRTPLSIEHNGSGPVTITGQTEQQRNGSMKITWPQSAGLGVAVRPHKRLLASVQADWVGWSSVQKLEIVLDQIGPQARMMRYSDSFAFHAGLQATFARFMQGRIGYTFDSNVIPNRTMRRENQDAPKHILGFGVGLHFWKLFIDLAFETFLPVGARTIPTQIGMENEAGVYDARVYSMELALHFRF